MFWNKEWWAEYCIDGFASGSKVICDPPVTNTDEDFLLLVDVTVLKPFEQKLLESGFKLGGSGSKTVKILWLEPGKPVPDGYKVDLELKGGGLKGYKQISQIDPFKPLLEFPDFKDSDKAGVFRSWKKDQLNLILTCSIEYFDNFYRATRLARYLNLLKKTDRIALFQAITFDDWP